MRCSASAKASCRCKSACSRQQGAAQCQARRARNDFELNCEANHLRTIPVPARTGRGSNRDRRAADARQKAGPQRFDTGKKIGHKHVFRLADGMGVKPAGGQKIFRIMRPAMGRCDEQGLCRRFRAGSKNQKPDFLFHGKIYHTSPRKHIR